MITNISRDARYPSAGQTIAILATFNAGNRFRCYLYDKPAASALVVSDPTDPTYLPDNKFTPDVAGVFTIRVVEELVTVRVSHFSNDVGKHVWDPPGTVPAAVVIVTPIDQDPDPAVTRCYQTYYVTVGAVVTRAIGIAPDTCTVTMLATTNEATSPWYLTPTRGVLTAKYDRTRAAALSTPTSDRARIAMGSSTVSAAVRDIGGNGGVGYVYGERACESVIILSWDDVIDSGIIDSFGWTIRRMNQHITRDVLDVHGAADAANTITSAVGAVGDAGSQVTRLNDIAATLALHAANNPGAYHHDADTVATAALAAIAPLAAGATLAQRVDRTNVLFDIVDNHLTRERLTLDAVAYAHDDVADNHLDFATHYPAFDESSAVLSMNATATGYESHRTRVNVVAAGYHVILGTTDNTYNTARPVSKATYISAVCTALNIWNCHLQNINPTTSASVGYHAEPDSVRTDTIGGPTDYASAIAAHEALDWSIAAHAAKGSPVHGSAWAGYAKWKPRGMAKIHDAFRTAMQAAAPTIPSGENYASAQMIAVGGWKSV